MQSSGLTTTSYILYFSELSSIYIQVSRSKESISQLAFLQNILEPYIEAYWLTGGQLLELKDTVHKGSNHDYNSCSVDSR